MWNVRRLLVGFLLVAASSAQDSAGVELFETRVRPILAKNCYVCHSADSPKVQGALKLDSPEALMAGGNAGPPVVAGKPERSLLMRVLSHADELKMPPGAKLADDDIAAIAKWIRMGAPLPTTALLTEAEKAKSDHWAFQPLSNPTPPDVKSDWIRSPIDAFVVARLRQQQLDPSDEADRRTLIRRAHFDLTGLPPSAEEVESAEPYEQIVDRLLASKHFGERWARYWLDIARYSDEGIQARAFAISWTYRDWVIEAFNEDMPYDKFVQRQLAADLLGGDKRHLAALGMLTVGINLPRPTDVPENLDDRIDVATRGFLGLSVACARCHDHKFDPIPQKDYYSLYSIFLNSPDVMEPVAIDPIPDTKQGRFYSEKLKMRSQWLGTFARERLEDHKADFRKAETLERYLTVAWAGRDASNNEVEFLSNERNLNLYVLQRWVNLLAASLDAGDGRFQELVDSDGAAIPDFAIKLAEANSAEPWPDPAKERLRQLLRADGAPTNVPIEDFWWIQNEGDSNTLKILGWAYKAVMTDWGYRGGPRHAMAVRDAETPEQAVVFVRGNQHDRGAEVNPRFLTARGATRFREGSGRLELAQAIADQENPLTARVMVNRVWQHLFGSGLVRTPSNFGLRGDAPTHPELLDYLASKFIAGGWSIKALIREIMLSSAYRQASSHAEDCADADPENLLLWRQNRRRLDFEALRDSMLAVSNRLDPTLGGGPFDLEARPSPRRRSVYAYISREEPSGTMRSFDFSNPEQHTPQRDLTTVPQQALFLMNSRFVGEQARYLAERLGSGHDASRAEELYRLVLARNPTGRERQLAVDFVSKGARVEPVIRDPSPWQYGSGELDPQAGKVAKFRPFGVWVDEKWQHASMLPAPEGGRAGLSAAGGAPGDDLSSAVVRRWVSPVSGKIKISGSLNHAMSAAAWRFNYSNGVRGWVVSDRKGVLANWTAQGVKVSTDIEGLKVEPGEVIDFVVDARDDYVQDDFTWAPEIEQMLTAEEKKQGMEAVRWSASDDFRGPVDEPLTSWERLAQVLLLTNEFAFVD